MTHPFETNSHASLLNEVDFSQRSSAPTTDLQFVHRWSPRAFQKQNISQADLTTIFDAARWSPSCFNEQPWQFYTSTEKTFDQFLNILVEANQSWAKEASVLGFITARQFFNKNGKPNPYADFDTGSAWMAVALQAEKIGLHAHGMAGFDIRKAEAFLKIDPQNERVICAIALGRRGSPETLSEHYRAIEKPSARKALENIWHSLD